MKLQGCGRILAALAALAATSFSVGCHCAPKRKIHDSAPVSPVPNMPRELSKVLLPTYIVEPPDILVIDTVRIVPKGPYRLRTFDVLVISVAGTLPDAPIHGTFTIEPGGTVNLGSPYGTIRVAGMTIDEIQHAISNRLSQMLREPEVTVTLGELASSQQISGQHLVGPDGTVTLGVYGVVGVAGLTVPQIKTAIERHLSQFLDEPEVSVEVYAFNSKSFYVVLQGAGLGDGVVKFPYTGNDTVLDAISQVNGLESVSSKRIWIARPNASADGCQVLDVDYTAITECGSVATNYQLLPGDRLFIAEDNLVAFDNRLAKVLAPAERVFGFTLLGTNTVSRLKFFSRGPTGVTQ